MHDLPPPEYPRHACPVCGFRPCSYQCRLGLQQWDLEMLEEMFAGFDPPEGDDDCDCDEEDD